MPVYTSDGNRWQPYYSETSGDLDERGYIVISYVNPMNGDVLLQHPTVHMARKSGTSEWQSASQEMGTGKLTNRFVGHMEDWYRRNPEVGYVILKNEILLGSKDITAPADTHGNFGISWGLRDGVYNCSIIDNMMYFQGKNGSSYFRKQKFFGGGNAHFSLVGSSPTPPFGSKTPLSSHTVYDRYNNSLIYFHWVRHGAGSSIHPANISITSPNYGRSCAVPEYRLPWSPREHYTPCISRVGGISFNDTAYTTFRSLWESRDLILGDAIDNKYDYYLNITHDKNKPIAVNNTGTTVAILQAIDLCASYSDSSKNLIIYSQDGGESWEVAISIIKAGHNFYDTIFYINDLFFAYSMTDGTGNSSVDEYYGLIASKDGINWYEISDFDGFRINSIWFLEGSYHLSITEGEHWDANKQMKGRIIRRSSSFFEQVFLNDGYKIPNAQSTSTVTSAIGGGYQGIIKLGEPTVTQGEYPSEGPTHTPRGVTTTTSSTTTTSTTTTTTTTAAPTTTTTTTTAPMTSESLGMFINGVMLSSTGEFPMAILGHDSACNLADDSSDVYIYDYEAGWNLRNKLSQPVNSVDGTSSKFGQSVSTNHDLSRIAIGSPLYADPRSPSNKLGTAFIYNWNGVNYNLDIKSSGTHHLENYGFSVSLDKFGNKIAIGAPEWQSTNDYASGVVASGYGELKQEKSINVHDFEPQSNETYGLRVGDVLVYHPEYDGRDHIAINESGNRIAVAKHYSNLAHPTLATTTTLSPSTPSGVKIHHHLYQGGSPDEACANRGVQSVIAYWIGDDNDNGIDINTKLSTDYNLTNNYPNGYYSIHYTGTSADESWIHVSGGKIIDNGLCSNLWENSSYVQVLDFNGSSWNVVGTPINSGSFLTKELTQDLEIISMDMNPSGDVLAVSWRDEYKFQTKYDPYYVNANLHDDYYVGIYNWSDSLSNWERKGDHIHYKISSYTSDNRNRDLHRIAGSFGDQVKITNNGNRVFVKNVPADPYSQQSIEIFDYNGSTWEHYDSIEVGRNVYEEDYTYTEGVFDIPLSSGAVHSPREIFCDSATTTTTTMSPFSGFYIGPDECTTTTTTSTTTTTTTTTTPIPHTYTISFGDVVYNDYLPIQTNFPSDISLDSDKGIFLAIGHGHAYECELSDGIIKIMLFNGLSWIELSTVVGEIVYKDPNNDGFFGCTGGAEFGFSVDLNSTSTFLIGGAPKYNNIGYSKIHYNEGRNWPLLGHEIIGNYSYPSGQFGFDVAVSRGRKSSLSVVDYNPVAVIGSPYVDHAGTNAGMISIYRYTDKSTVAEPWDLVQEIHGPEANAQFGYSVSIDLTGDLIVVGSPHTTSKGRVYVYKYNESADQYFMLGSYIEGVADADSFGYSVDLSDVGDIAGDPTLIVGAPNYGGGISSKANRGYVKVFTFKNNNWVTTQSQIDSNRSDWFLGGQANTRLGHSVSISNDSNRIAFSSMPSGNKGNFVQVFDLYKPTNALKKWYYPRNIESNNSSFITGGTHGVDYYGSDISLGGEKVSIAAVASGIDILTLDKTESHPLILANPDLHGPYSDDVIDPNLDITLCTVKRKKSETAYCVAYNQPNNATAKYSFFAPGQLWYKDHRLSIKYEDGYYRVFGPSNGVSEFEGGWAKITDGEVVDGGSLVCYDYPTSK